MTKPKLTKARLVARAYMPLGQTPDYVLDVERENERRRAELNGLVNLQANSRLVAAAPELLEALQLGKDFLIGSTAWTQAQVDELTEKICAAIAKATGGQQ